jgi:hypothetical protein
MLVTIKVYVVQKRYSMEKKDNRSVWLKIATYIQVKVHMLKEVKRLARFR